METKIIKHKKPGNQKSKNKKTKAGIYIKQTPETENRNKTQIGKPRTGNETETTTKVKT